MSPLGRVCEGCTVQTILGSNITLTRVGYACTYVCLQGQRVRNNGTNWIA